MIITKKLKSRESESKAIFFLITVIDNDNIDISYLNTIMILAN